MWEEKIKNSLHSDNMDTGTMMVKLKNFTGLPTVKPVEGGTGNKWKVMIFRNVLGTGKMNSNERKLFIAST
jgi:hypothetical protein